MSLDIRCDRCGDALTEPGGLAFSPPSSPFSSAGATVRKLHICVGCWPALEAFLQPPPLVPDEPTSDESFEHVGHGEGMSMFIGHVSGCPACEAVGVPDEPTKRWIPSQEALAAATTTMTVYGPDGPTEMRVLRRPLLHSHSTGEERDR